MTTALRLAILLVAAAAGAACMMSFPPLSDAPVAFHTPGAVTPAIAQGDPLFEEQAIFAAVPEKIGSHAATITAFDDGELLAAWYAYDGPHELDGAVLFTARRRPGRAGWEPPRPQSDPGLRSANPVLYREGERVWLFHAVVPFGWSTAHIEVSESTDRGTTWSRRRVVSAGLGTNVRFPPVRTAGGTLLLPAYDETFSRSLFFSSPDGENWTLEAAVATASPHGNIQPSLATLPDGGVLAVMRNTGQGWLWATTSDDGQHWAEPADAGFANPNSPAALHRLASGNLVLVFNDSPIRRAPLAIAISGDDGATWAAQRTLAAGELKYSYPSIAQAPDGIIHVVYSHNRETIRHVALNEAWILEE